MTGRRTRAWALSLFGTAWVAAGCASAPVPEPPPKTAEDLYREAEQLLEGTRVLFVLESVDYPRVIASFQEIIDEFPFSEFATLSELKIGDAYFAQSDFAQALSFYQEFVTLHPTHPKVPYALLKSGECSFAQMLAPDQDQGKTRDAIRQFDSLIDRYPDSEDVERARELRKEAIDRLAVAEVLVGDFYFSTEKYHAAVPRYRDALSQSPQHTGYRSTRARLGMSLLRTGETTEGQQLLRGVLTDPELDPEVRERAVAESGLDVAVEVPVAEASESRGWRLWPFGGGGRSEPEIAASSEAPAPSQAAAAAPDASLEDEAPQEEGGGFWSWLWPF